MNLKSSKLRKPCKFTVDTKDGKVCKPEKFSRRFSGCNFSIFLGDTICSISLEGDNSWIQLKAPGLLVFGVSALGKAAG